MTNLDVVLLPCRGQQWLLFPQAVVGRVSPYAPTLTAENASEFVVGSMLVQNEKMPVLDFDFAGTEDSYDGVYRILLVSTITNQSMYRRYAVISYGEPELLNIHEEDIQTLKGGHHRFIPQQVAIVGHENKTIFLPDLPLFESELRMR